MKKTIAWRAFRKYLHDKGYSYESNAGNRSTTSNYPNRIDTICRKEKIATWDEFGEQINNIIKKYSAGGQEKIFGSQSHGSNLKALELFKEFYVVFDSENIL